MPKYEDYVDEQDWDIISWNKKPNNKEIDQNSNIPDKTNITIEKIAFNRQLILARQKAQYTPNKLAQALHIKLKDLESFENGTKVPEKNVLYKMNKLLNSKLQDILQ